MGIVQLSCTTKMRTRMGKLMPVEMILRGGEDVGELPREFGIIYADE